MKFFYIDKEIQNQKLRDFLKLDTYSEIAFQRSSFKEIINNSVKDKLDIIFTLSESLLIVCSSILSSIELKIPSQSLLNSISLFAV